MGWVAGGSKPRALIGWAYRRAVAGHTARAKVSGRGEREKEEATGERGGSPVAEEATVMGTSVDSGETGEREKNEAEPEEMALTRGTWSRLVAGLRGCTGPLASQVRVGAPPPRGSLWCAWTSFYS